MMKKIILNTTLVMVLLLAAGCTQKTNTQKNDSALAESSVMTTDKAEVPEVSSGRDTAVVETDYEKQIDQILNEIDKSMADLEAENDFSDFEI